MSLGAGALKVEGPIAQKGSLALEVTMATKRALTTQHRHTEEKFSGIVTTTHTYLSRGGRSGSKTGRYHNQWLVMICNDHKAKQSKSEICQHMSALEDCTATPHRPACLGLNRWPASIVSRLTLSTLQFSHIKNIFIFMLIGAVFIY